MAGLHDDVIWDSGSDESCGIGGNKPAAEDKVSDDEASSDSIIVEEDWRGDERILREHRFKKVSSNEKKQPGTSNSFEKLVKKVGSFEEKQLGTANSFKKVAGLGKKQLGISSSVEKVASLKELQLGTSNSFKEGSSLEKKQVGTSNSVEKVCSLKDLQPGHSNRVEKIVKKVSSFKENHPGTPNSFKKLVEKDSNDKETTNSEVSDLSNFGSNSRDSEVIDIKKKKIERQKCKYVKAECIKDENTELGNKSPGNSSRSSRISTDEIEVIDVSDDEISIISSKDNPKSLIELPNDAAGGFSKAIKNDSDSPYVKFKPTPSAVFKNNVLLPDNGAQSSETKRRRRIIIRYCDDCRAKNRIILKRLKTKPSYDNEFDEDASLLSNIQLPTHSESISKPSYDIKNSTYSPRNVSISKTSNDLKNSTSSPHHVSLSKTSNDLKNSTDSPCNVYILKTSTELKNSTSSPHNLSISKLSTDLKNSTDSPCNVSISKTSNELKNSTHLTHHESFSKHSNKLINSTNVSPKPGCSKDRPTFSKPSNEFNKSTNLSPKPGCSKDRPTENKNLNLTWEDINECEEIVENLERESLESSQKPRNCRKTGNKESNLECADEKSWKNSSDDENVIKRLEVFAESRKCSPTVEQEVSMISGEENGSQICSLDKNAPKNCSADKNASRSCRSDYSTSLDCSSDEKVSQNHRSVESVSQNCRLDGNASQICRSPSDKKNTLVHIEMSQENSQKSSKSMTENCEAEQELRSSFKTTNPTSSHVRHISAFTQNQNRVGFNTSTTHNKRTQTSCYARSKHKNSIYNTNNYLDESINEKAQSFSSEYEEPNSFPPAKRKIATISSNENASNLSKIRNVTVSNCSTSGNLRTSSKNCSASGNIVVYSFENVPANRNKLSESENPPFDGNKASKYNNLPLTSESVPTNENVASTSNNVLAYGNAASTSEIVPANENVVSESKNVSSNRNLASQFENVCDIGKFVLTYNLLIKNKRKNASQCESDLMSDRLERLKLFAAERFLEKVPKLPPEKQTEVLDEILKLYPQHKNLASTSISEVSARRYLDKEIRRISAERINRSSQSVEQSTSSRRGDSSLDKYRAYIISVESLDEMIPSQFKISRQIDNADKTVSQSSERSKSVTQNKPKYKTLKDVLERYGSAFGDQEHFHFSYRMKKFLGLNPNGSPVLSRKKHARCETEMEASSSSNHQRHTSNSSNLSAQNSEPIRNLTTVQEADDRSARSSFENRLRCYPQVEKFQRNFATIRNTREQNIVTYDDESSRTLFRTELNPNYPQFRMKVDEDHDNVNVQTLYSIPKSMRTSHVKSERNDYKSNKQDIVIVYDDKDSLFPTVNQYSNVGNDSQISFSNLRQCTKSTAQSNMSATSTVKSEQNDDMSLKQEVITVSDDVDSLFPTENCFSNYSQTSFLNSTRCTKSDADNSWKITTSHRNVRLDKLGFHRKKNDSNLSASQNKSQNIQRIEQTTKRENELGSEIGKYNLQIKKEIITISDDENENDSASNALSNHNLTINQRRFNTGLSSEYNSQSNSSKNEIRDSNVECTRTCKSNPSRNEILGSFVNFESHAFSNDTSNSNLLESDSEYLQYVHPSSQLNSTRRANDCASSKNKEFLQCVVTDKSLPKKIVGIKQVIDKDGWIHVDMKQVKPPRVKKCSCFYRDTYMMPYVDPEPCVNCVLGVENRRTHEEYVNKFLKTNRPFVSMSLEEVSCSRNLVDWAHTNVKVIGQLRMRGMTETSHNGQPPYLCKEVDHDFYLQSLDEPGGPFNVCIDFDRVKRAMPLAGKQIEACAELCVVTSSARVESLTSSSVVEPFLKAMLYRDLDIVDRGTLKAYTRALDMMKSFVPLFLRADRLGAPVNDDSCLDEEFDANKPRLV